VPEDPLEREHEPRAEREEREQKAAHGVIFVTEKRRPALAGPLPMDLTGQLSNPPEPLARLLSILSRPTVRTKR
jgi:hypothetical protein